MAELEERWHPVRPITVVSRPQSVWWARVPDGHTRDGQRYATGPLCQEQEHPVYLAVRPQHETMPGCQGNERARTFYVCGMCSPPAEQGEA